MTPQAFSYGTLANNGMIYMPPYGLEDSLDYMLKLDPTTYTVSRIQLTVGNSYEKWTTGIVVDNKIFFLPFNEDRILIVNTDNDSVEYIMVGAVGKGKHYCCHLYNNKIISLPYGVDTEYNYAIIFDIATYDVIYKNISTPINDTKKWHTTQLIGNTIHGLPRGERWSAPYFPYRIEFNCDDYSYNLIDMSVLWTDIDKEGFSNKKYTTLAKYKNKLFAPPYSENKNFDLMSMFDGSKWSYINTNLKTTSRKYYSHVVASNGKIYFPPAGHEETWSEMLVIDGETNDWLTVDLGIGKESKKYFAGVENSQGKIYYIPRGGCVCEPESDWKRYGDLAEVLVIDTNTDLCYTVDISEYFLDNTTIEKYNQCIIVNDKIFAFPYGESSSFQTLLVFDTITETVIKTIDLNDI